MSPSRPLCLPRHEVARPPRLSRHVYLKPLVPKLRITNSVPKTSVTLKPLSGIETEVPVPQISPQAVRQLNSTRHFTR